LRATNTCVFNAAADDALAFASCCQLMSRVQSGFPAAKGQQERARETVEEKEREGDRVKVGLVIA